MLGRFQVADEIVVFERRRREEEDVDTHSHERDERQTSARPAKHVNP